MIVKANGSNCNESSVSKIQLEVVELYLAVGFYCIIVMWMLYQAGKIGVSQEQHIGQNDRRWLDESVILQDWKLSTLECKLRKEGHVPDPSQYDTMSKNSSQMYAELYQYYLLFLFVQGALIFFSFFYYLFSKHSFGNLARRLYCHHVFCYKFCELCTETKECVSFATGRVSFNIKKQRR